MTDLRPADVTAVVATFHPDEQVVATVSRLSTQVGRVIVVDDGSGPQWDETLSRLGTGIDLLRLPQNVGIAAALNAGARAALASGASAVLTLDQDSQVAEDYAAEAITALARQRRESAMIAAGTQSGSPVRPVRFADRGDAVTPTLEAIQSGMLIPKSVFDRIGYFDERLFIDCVDTDFTLRAAAAGIPTYLARRCAIDHPLGTRIDTPVARVTRSGRRSFAFHPAWRRYYISRNRAVVFTRNAAARPDWVAVGLAAEVVQLLRCLVFGPDKLRQGAAVALGVADAVRGRRGRLAGAVAALLGAPS